MPVDRRLTEVEQVVAPSLRSGAVVRFDAQRFQGITGRIRERQGATTVPVEFYEITLENAPGVAPFPTGQAGEFYIENVPPGTYRAAYGFNAGRCSFDLEIPPSQESLLDLGEVFCEPQR